MIKIIGSIIIFGGILGALLNLLQILNSFHFVSLVVGFLNILVVVIGVGLLKLKEWARHGAIFILLLSCFGLLFYGVVWGFNTLMIIKISLSVVIVGLLLTSKVKQQFQQSS